MFAVCTAAAGDGDWGRIGRGAELTMGATGMFSGIAKQGASWTCRLLTAGRSAGQGAAYGAAVGGLTGLSNGYAHYGTAGMFDAALDGAFEGAIFGGLSGAVHGLANPKICFVAGTQVVVGIQEDDGEPLAQAHVAGESAAAVAAAPRVRYLTLPIEQLVARGGGECGSGGGQRVLCRDHHDPAGPLVRRAITRTYQRTAYVLRVLTVLDDSGREQTLRVTEEHPFHVAGRGWTKAKDLLPGEVLSGPCDESSTVIANLREDHPEGVTVYNLEVEDAHTYFVRAEGSDAEPVWVHNAGYPNLNTNGARASYAVYEIEVNGTLYKVGKAHTGRITRKSGLPTRLHQQVRKLQELHGVENVRYTVTRLRRTTTAKAKAAETKRLQEYYDRTGLIPEGNKKSFVPKIG